MYIYTNRKRLLTAEREIHCSFRFLFAKSDARRAVRL